MFKNINWKNIATIAVVAVLVFILYPRFVRPLLQKLPFIGSYA